MTRGKTDGQRNRNQDLPLQTLPGFPMTGGALNVDFAVWAMGLFYVGMFVALILEHIYEGK